MTTIGGRLRAERKRLGHSQAQFAELAGVHKNAQSNYEGDLRRPDADYLVQVAAFGVDVLYVLTGQSSPALLSADEEMLLTGYRALDQKGRAGVLGMISGMTQPEPSVTNIAFKGPVGQQVHGDVSYTDSVAFNVGEGRKKKK
jgi:transcriptional regulator with XRE-family HTH domain